MVAFFLSILSGAPRPKGVRDAQGVADPASLWSPFFAATRGKAFLAKGRPQFRRSSSAARGAK